MGKRKYNSLSRSSGLLGFVSNELYDPNVGSFLRSYIHTCIHQCMLMVDQIQFQQAIGVDEQKLEISFDIRNPYESDSDSDSDEDYVNVVVIDIRGYIVEDEDDMMQYINDTITPLEDFGWQALFDLTFGDDVIIVPYHKDGECQLALVYHFDLE